MRLQSKFVFSAVTACLLLTSIYLGATVYHYRISASRYKNDIHYAREIIAIHNNTRDVALKGDVTNAVDCLYKLQAPSNNLSFKNPAAEIIEMERRRAVRDVINYLRSKTGQNYGDDPYKWIMQFGDEPCKEAEKRFLDASK